MKTIIATTMILAALAIVSACGPSKPEISTTVQQTFAATNLSILSQVDWKQVMTRLRGKVGPDFVLIVEAYMKQTAGLEIRIRGGEVEIETQASGTGGKEYDPRVMDALIAVQQRWERADDEARKDKARWTEAVIDALIEADMSQRDKDQHSSATTQATE